MQGPIWWNFHITEVILSGLDAVKRFPRNARSGFHTAGAANLTGPTTYMRPLLCCFLLLFGAFAQAQSVRGTVRSSRLEALPFVSVEVKDLRIGTLTKEDGSYELKLEPGSYELVFSMVGYRSQVI